MKRLFCTFWTLLLLLLTLPARAESGEVQALFKNYSTRQGLPHNRISDIHTDSQGFVWICTWYGVSRFDGYTFKNYSTTPGDASPLSHNRFLSVDEDHSGHLWFQVYNHHIYRFNRHTEHFEDPVALLDGVDSKHYRATLLRCDGRGGVWVVIPGIGVIRFESERDDSPIRVGCWLRSAEWLGGVAGLWIDSANHCWIATESGTLYRVRAGEAEAELMGEGYLPIRQMTSIRGTTYMTSGRGLYRHTEGDSLLRWVADLPHPTALAADTLHQRLYVGCQDGSIHHLELSDGQLQPLTTLPRRERIRALTVDSHGTLWITTPEAGIARYSPERGNCKHFEQKPYTVSYHIDTIPKIAEAGGRLWIKMNKYGFGYYDREQDRVMPFYNDPDSSECLMTNAVVRFDARGDVLWLTTHYERGLRCAIMQQPVADLRRIDTRKGDPMSREVRALMNDRQGHLWVGTKTGELIRYDSQQKPLWRYAGKQELGAIYALKEDRQGRIWVGTRYDGLYRFDPAGEEYRLAAHYRHREGDDYSLSSDHIYSLEEDDLGRLWVATYGGGVNLYEQASERFFHAENQLLHYPLEEADRVRWLLNDGQGRMLAATVDGLLLFRPEESVRRIEFSLVQRATEDSTSLGNNDIIHMTRDRRGRIWLATYGGGLNRIEGYDEAGVPHFRHYDTRQGLPSNICMSVVEDPLGHIWVGTQHAVSRLDEQKSLFRSYRLYEKSRSALLNEAAALTSSDGSVLFGSGANLYAFDPMESADSVVEYRLHLTDLSVRNRPARIGSGEPLARSIVGAERIDLDYHYSNFRIEFAALNYALQDEIGYMYKLEGYDRDWNIAGRVNSASYSNLPPGHYTFRVRAYVGSQALAGAERTIDLVVHPPFYLSWWAWTLYLLLALGCIVVAWRLFNSMQRMRREARMEQEMTDMKLQFFTNISHELRTPLTLILGGIEDVRKHDELSPRGGISLNLAQKNARRMLSMINQLLDFRKIVKNKMELKISRVNLVQLVEEAVEDFREMAAERHIELLFTVSRRSILVWIDLERMESVIYNLLSNAFKFTHNRGRIEVILTVSEADEQVVMMVRDNGIGIPKDQQQAIFERFHQASRSVEGRMKGSGIGLALCRDIVALHHGEIGVESRPNEGATFLVRLRLGNAHFEMEQINFGEASSEGHPQYMVSDYVSVDNERRTDVSPPLNRQKFYWWMTTASCVCLCITA